jgi:hypothetical protein
MEQRTVGQAMPIARGLGLLLLALGAPMLGAFAFRLRVTA